MREPLRFTGVGLHTGNDARAIVLPAAPDTGLVFVLEGGVTIPALAEFVVDTSRATVLGRDGARVSTVEHLLSALRGMGIDNARIEVEGGEVPAMDGSAKTFADAIHAAGTVASDVPRQTFRPDRAMGFRDDDKTVAIIPSIAWRIKFTVVYPAPIGTQYFEAEITPELYREQIAPARTFGYLHEIEALLARGLARGGTLDNAIVFAPDGPMQPLAVARRTGASQSARHDRRFCAARNVSAVRGRRAQERAQAPRRRHGRVTGIGKSWRLVESGQNQ